ncbi:MAG: DNA-formamidopyrimidine glycosylase family protein [Promethearchaeota archaeon]
MSIELPETFILAKQMNQELSGKTIKSYQLKDVEKFQKDGVVNKLEDFNQLIDGTIQEVTAKGMTMIIKLDNDMDLLLVAEYGGKILYHTQGDPLPKKIHLVLTFTDNTFLTVRITYGYILAWPDDQLEKLYVYKRDYRVLSPLDEKFNVELLIELLSGKEQMLRPLIVGKNAIISGIGNYSWQEIVYQAKIHPKTRASDLTKEEIHQLYDAIKDIIQTRIEKGGKTKFVDLYGKQGGVKQVLGSFILNQPCPTCETPIKKISLGGGTTYYCPSCQKK